MILFQSLLSCGLSILFAMPRWWQLIHFGFPIAIASMWWLDIPPGYYLAGFLITLSLFWTIHQTRVPLYPSRLPVWTELLRLVPADRPVAFMDIGSGLGDLAMHVARQRPLARISGIEIAPLPWLISWLRAKTRRSPACFLLGNYHKLNFRQYDFIFAYLSPAAMPALWEKAKREMRPGSFLLSYEFEIPDVSPTRIIEVSGSPAVIHLWII